jgi:lipopolysaccharide transport system permease protein
MKQPPVTTVATNLPVRVIVPHSGLAGFQYAMASLWVGFPAALRLALRFFLRDTKAAYRQSLLGYFWILLPPVANTLVWVMLNKSGVVSIDPGGVPYPIFVLAGTVLWAAFNGAIVATLGVVGEARGLLSKVNFPHESLVYNAFLKALVDATIPASLIIAALFFYPVELGIHALLFPVALLGLLLLGMAIGVILIPLATLYSDVGRGVQLALRFGFFVTPVIFPLPAAEPARTLMSLNPATPLIVSGRSWLVGAGDSMPVAFFGVILASLLVIAIGLLLFKVAMPHLIERLSS